MPSIRQENAERICRRAVADSAGKMAAVLKFPVDTLQELYSSISQHEHMMVEIVNDNAEDQLVVVGHSEAVYRLGAKNPHL